MNILVLSPHPFYQERGSPIALNFILRVLSERSDRVDVIVYHEGKEVNYKNVTIHRTCRIPFITNIRPGFSWKKVFCDIFMFVKAIDLIGRNHYHVIHAVEESVYIALILKWLFKVPYLYDMDSSLAQQMLEKYFFLQPLRYLFNFFEGLAVKNAMMVLAVCEALAERIEQYHPKKVVILQDISLLKEAESY